MPKYCFILGSNLTLSKAEIFSYLENFDIKFKVVFQANEAIIIEINQELKIEKIQSKLGGTIKIGKIIDEINPKNLESKLNTDLLEKKFFKQKKQKIIFGFSVYGGNVKKLNQLLKKIGLNIKKELVKNEYKSRFVTSRDTNLSSVIVKKNKLVSQGAEILVINGKEKIFLGKTLSIQDFEDYSKRDYGRPKRDKRVGLIPPKLAQILINLAQIRYDQNIFDPFCGSGTIIQEGILVGYKNIIGSDISKKAMEDTKQNIDWLFVEYSNLKRTDFNLKLFRSDVKEISEHIPGNQIDAIITEPHLGPIFSGRPQLKNIKLIVKELSDLYLKSFQEFLKIIKPTGKIVIIFPSWRIKNKIIYLPILEKINMLGYKIKKFNFIRTTDHGSIIYSRPDQKVLREIFVFLM